MKKSKESNGTKHRKDDNSVLSSSIDNGGIKRKDVTEDVTMATMTTPITKSKKGKKKKKGEKIKKEYPTEHKKKKSRIRSGDNGSNDTYESSFANNRASGDEMEGEDGEGGLPTIAISKDAEANQRKKEEKFCCKNATDERNDKMSKVDEDENYNNIHMKNSNANNNIDVDNKEATEIRDDEDQENQEDKVVVGKKRKRKRKRKKKNSPTEETGDSDCNGVTSTTDGVISQEDKLSSLEYTVYVEGVRFDGSETDVKDFFVQNGCPDVLQMRMARWQDSGRLRGYGHVVFNTTTSCAKAISDLNGLNLNGRYLTIRPSHQRATAAPPAPRAQPTGCRTVFVKNLPYDSSEEEIQTTFRSCGKIVDGGVRLARNYATLQFKGFAYVEFKNPEGAQSAVNRGAKVGGIEVRGRACFVDYDEGAVKGSYRGGDGKLWQKEYGTGSKSKGGSGGGGNSTTHL